MQQTLRLGKSDLAVEPRCSFVVCAGRQSGKRLGLLGDDFVDLDAEGLVRTSAADRRSSHSKTSSGARPDSADGVPHIFGSVYLDPLSTPPSRAPCDFSVAWLS